MQSKSLTRRAFVGATAGAAALGAAPRAILGRAAEASARSTHLWEKQEIVLTSQRTFPNPYTDVTVWVDLTGPGFNKRVYGFWDGGAKFRVRVVATAPGTWSWRSGSEPADTGLAGKSGTFEPSTWTEAEKQQNPLRRGFLHPLQDHALQTADGTPFFVLGDTWWATGTNRFRWYDDDVGAAHRPHSRLQRLRSLSQGAGLQLDQHACRISQLGDRRLARAHRDERRGPYNCA